MPTIQGISSLDRTLDAALADSPVTDGAAVVFDADGPVATSGSTRRAFDLASVTKLFTATAVLIAHEEGSLALEDPAGPEGSTIAHLLAHASGLGPDGGELSPPAKRRIYSNAGYELLAGILTDRTGMAAARYAAEALGPPLELTETTFAGSAAHGHTASALDVAALAVAWLTPGRLLAAETVARATRPFLPDLAGVLPGFGSQDPNEWGLGPEIRGHKSPHWTGARNSPATFGHFGRSGTLCWIDPTHGCGLIWLGDAPFGDWATEAWPRLSDAVLEEFSGSTGTN